MNWGKVVYVFFALMSLTTAAEFLYDKSPIALFVAASINLVSTLLKIGVRNVLAAELFASSLVADLHLIPAFVVLQVSANMTLAYSLVIGAVIANVFSLALVLIESSKSQDEF
ncbi:DUF6394 family protein [Campylobacter gastrosuis]|uniref:DUF6394 family protein n=1 Tax=Campylobacter gastrosuis TaxID=2974576 RepID=A0ABT7HLV8_9BACT|nr:DUF6394 family protein [Campylobacter gastrosuis]MDL0087951.1 DUF6394 family protein [Campylobacter gastrosuis]